MELRIRLNKKRKTVRIAAVGWRAGGLVTAGNQVEWRLHETKEAARATTELFKRHYGPQPRLPYEPVKGNTEDGD